MQKVSVIGASGYTGVELLRLLAGHPRAEVISVTSRQFEGMSIGQVFPSLKGYYDLKCETVDIKTIAAQADLVFTALPHKSAMEIIPEFLSEGCKVIDLSADYRLQDQHVYEAWYQAHTSPELLAEAVYGLPEINRAQIKNARLVANPGCYPTSVALGLAPLLLGKLIDHTSLIIDSKSGTTGAGRGLKEGSLFCEVNEGFKAYGLASHRHTPEIEQTLSQLAGEAVTVTFTPHLLPVDRGILSTIYASQTQGKSTAELIELFQGHYAAEPFVRVLPEGQLPNISYVRGTNLCDIGLVADERTGRVIVVSVIDNLCKGAAGQAVQNFNLISGFDERTGLSAAPLFP
ncbi:N-acetyl-gamma-glutamyl-phosphate reductase [Geopsychrobacter electrodiphilus]|uniref:N-acetyl-gamma-glutamyl-phosphate reductase n=1 Tax=Geopsychrobacter electrodiphilus TaxID=225196 RepID=UPI00037819F6|nr:N-acetyl-gamma-glutamyl-phosphate reductase [Geopsychrobacter electrodiphilus]